MLCHSHVLVSNKSCDFIVQSLFCPYFIMLTKRKRLNMKFQLVLVNVVIYAVSMTSFLT